VSFGSPLGLEHIAAEYSTNDGTVHDLLVRPVPKAVRGVMPRAVDGLQFASRDALYIHFASHILKSSRISDSLAYRAGVTMGITAPSHTGFYSGLSTVFSLGAMHKLEEGAVLQDVAGLHISVSHFGGVSISTQIAALRRLLLDPPKATSALWFQQVIEVSAYSP
jgi:hypothetical protein